MRRALTENETPENNINIERYNELAALEDWILIITSGGYGKDHLHMSTVSLDEVDKVLRQLI